MTVRTASLGSIVTTVGLKGEVKLLPGPDFWAGALDASVFSLVSGTGAHRQVSVEKLRIKGNTYVIKFSGIETIDDALLAVGNMLEVSMENLVAGSAPEELRPFQVIGSTVMLADGTVVGTVVDMLLGREQDCLIMEKDGERKIIPNVPEIIKRVDLEKNIIEIDPPEGLLELRW